MLEADIVIGQIVGKEGPPIPIMAHPPATTSDLSLADFLSTVAQYNNGKSQQKGVKLDFKSIEAFEKSQEQIAQYSKPEVWSPIIFFYVSLFYFSHFRKVVVLCSKIWNNTDIYNKQRNVIIG